MTPVRIIQTFVRVCADCPHCSYYSGGMHMCSLTEEMISPDNKPYTVGKFCPLPYAGPPAAKGGCGMIRFAFFCIVWFAVGVGVQAAWSRNHGKTFSDEDMSKGVHIVGAILWPAYVIADIYMAVGPKKACDYGG